MPMTKAKFRKINALIHTKLGIDPETIKDVKEWIDYSRADYALKVERKIQYSAFKQALVEVANQLFKKEEDWYLLFYQPNISRRFHNKK